MSEELRLAVEFVGQLTTFITFIILGSYTIHKFAKDCISDKPTNKRGS